MTTSQDQARPKSCSYTVTFSGYRPAAAGRAGRIVQVPSTCGFPGKKQMDGAWYCARHYNTTARNKRVRAWIRHQRIACPEHPETPIKIQTSKRMVYCPTRLSPLGSRSCDWRMKVPAVLWNVPKEPQTNKLNA